MAASRTAVNMTPAHPGDFVRTEVIEELGLSVTKAAEILGVRRAGLSELLNGRATLSPEMALRIEKAFDVRMDLLLQMQAWYDAAQMRARAGEISVRRYQPA
ncbi:MAG: HigA family addiction module antitoxin [Chloroflexota bacterium]|nr:HigA family addiction module antitoxin [Chloroflexota bacterium]MDE2921061.1 HigA family addiction module antitoxin [Chloroflexota bacterium]